MKRFRKTLLAVLVGALLLLQTLPAFARSHDFGARPLAFPGDPGDGPGLLHFPGDPGDE